MALHYTTTHDRRPTFDAQLPHAFSRARSAIRLAFFDVDFPKPWTLGRLKIFLQHAFRVRLPCIPQASGPNGLGFLTR